MIKHAFFVILLFPFILKCQADLRMALLSEAITGEITPVKISIYSGKMNGRMNLTQTFPQGIIVNEQNSSSGIFSFSEGVLQIQWLNVNPQDSLFVEYSIFISDQQENFARVNSQISGYEDGIIKQIEFNDFQFQIINTNADTTKLADRKINKAPEMLSKTINSPSLNPKENSDSPGYPGIHFSIQLGAFRNEVEIPLLAKQSGLQADSIHYSVHKGLNKYYFGHFRTKEDASGCLQKHPQLAGKTFIVAFWEGERIELEEAIEKLNEK
jgi:hypothetical protein